MMKKIAVLIALMLLSNVAMARMYQWVDPDTRTTQLSGKPPSWYRSGETGPRILVYEKGQITDDTGISLSVKESDRLRQEAMIDAEQDRVAAMEKLQQARQQKATLDFQKHEEEVHADVVPATTEPQANTDAVAAAPEDTGPAAEELRALIEQYEKTKTQNAKELLDTTAPK